MKQTTKNMYFDDKIIYPLIVEHQKKLKFAQENNMPLPRPNDIIGKGIIDLCNNLAKIGKFSGYTFIDEMIEDAIIDCVKGIEKFDVEKWDQPFQYFTKCAYWAFLRRIENEAKENYIKYKNYSHTIVSENLDQFVEDEDMVLSNESFGYVISNYENKLKRKRLKNEEKKKSQISD